MPIKDDMMKRFNAITKRLKEITEVGHVGVMPGRDTVEQTKKTLCLPESHTDLQHVPLVKKD